ncbi:bifunctional proline dehydrogenase/L-glutamate gamma-semialdehyde dehydrogenase [Corynebacterium mastitidis]|uniref:L-glutamate gamma-semialdehyde dehydrogenase n=1 Tax=Corynebacterium mastitidis TaxID=161890 RepID=A0A2N0X794_9CORY|nr:bifunctional proline dehydrogenase/L-glutamate gamma-semialdehyde dehydrogenase [Corynebacterium mastitidis]MCH6197592.1 bifunctional proline dehydrogenase/L-glutamate gamma-semialdehyde dehydrogenase [Corynebacterium mastitidis]PKF68559.1 aldehyde dehydrogenase [Corynebacterium mastitidis]
MSITELPVPANSADVEAVVPQALRRAEDWLKQTDSESSRKETRATEQLADMVRDPEGVRFTMEFVDRVARPEDNKVAAASLRSLGEIPDFLGPANKAMMGLGALASRALPGVVMPVARARMRQLVGHLVLDAEGDALNKLLDKAAEQGTQLNLNLLGEAVLGEKEAKARTERTRQLIRNPRVTYVSVKASSLCAQLNHWDYEGSVARLKDRLRPLYQEAKARSSKVFINLDMEEYHDLHLTIRLFTELISEEEFTDLEAGIVLQAYLPDTLAALEELTEFALRRRAAGGAPIKVRLVKGANLSMERVAAESHGWKQAPYRTKDEVDANYLRLLDYVLQPEYADAIRIGVASHNLYTLALAWELAAARGVERQLDAEMLQGMAPAQSRAVRKVFGDLILYTPVVHAEDFDVAISYLVRRLEENSEKQNFLYSLFAPEVEGPDHLTPMGSQEQRFRRAVAERWTTFAGERRTQNRLEESGTQAPKIGRFVNEPDTDPAMAANRRWALEALRRGAEPIQAPEITDPAEVDGAVARAAELADPWGRLTGRERAEVLYRIADSLAEARGELLATMTHEARKTIDQCDPEISEAIDFASFYGHSAAALDDYAGVFTPHKVTVVVPPWNFPVAIPVGGMLSALAAGSAVIIKPAPQVVRCSEVAVAAIRRGLEAAGQDPNLVQLLRTDEGAAGKALISHDQVDQVILTGASDTAALFRSWNPRMAISAETSGKNSIIVTPSADPDLAVADLYQSAFKHSGQKCSAASLVILVGPQGRSQRFLGQLVDAVETLQVGHGTDVSTTMNGLIEPPSEKLRRGLTQLEPGETWLVKPRQLDEEGLLWSPGIRDNVKPGSWYHTHECFGPVLGIMHADTLEEAVEWQNSTGFGLTGGIHSLDDDEIEYWMEHVEVGNAYVNRGITGAIVQRQPFGGWKNSVVGPGAKAGGPNYVAQFGTWSDPETPLLARNVSVSPAVVALLDQFDDLSEADRAWLWRAAELDAVAWREEFGVQHDPTGLVSEANIFRYRRLLEPLRLRVGKGYALRDVVRLLLASAVTGVALDVSAPSELADELRRAGAEVRVASDDAYARGIARASSARVRTLGEVDPGLYVAAAESQSVVLDHPVVADGRRELLPFLLEQAVSVTMHRFGIPNQVGHIER